MPPDVIDRDLRGDLRQDTRFRSRNEAGAGLNVGGLIRTQGAVYLDLAAATGSPVALLAAPGDGRQRSVDHENRQLGGRPGVYLGEAGPGNWAVPWLAWQPQGRRVALDRWRQLEGAGA